MCKISPNQKTALEAIEKIQDGLLPVESHAWLISIFYRKLKGCLCRWSDSPSPTMYQNFDVTPKVPRYSIDGEQIRGKMMDSKYVCILCKYIENHIIVRGYYSIFCDGDE